MSKLRKAGAFTYILIAVVVLAIFAVRFAVGTVIAVSGHSMDPTFETGGFVFGTYLRADSDINVGDIVILQQDNKLLIKRVVGTPGMTIQDGVRDIPLTTLGEGQYYVVGDNYPVSRDSRDFGPVTRSNIIYKYASMYWSSFELILTVLVPLVLLLAAITMVFIPSDKQHIPAIIKNEITTDDTPLEA